MSQTIILGGGIAGTSAAEELRKLEPEAEISLIDQEQHPCYSRVLLPHYVKGKVPREKVFLKKPEWYRDQKIDWMPGVRVQAIDTNNRFVRTLDDRELPFDRLLLATGGELNLLNEDLRGVSYLRGIDDADHFLGLIREALKAGANSHGVVYGGGFIALEYINIFEHYGIPCTVLMRGKGFWSSVISSEASGVLRRHAEAHGVVIKTNEPMPQLIGDGALTGVRLKDGETLPANILGVGIGTSPDRAFFVEAGIDIGGGIIVNEYLETALPGVYAAGDGAEFYDVNVGRRVVYGTWMNAQMQGRAVAAIMHGDRKPFSLVSSYATTLLGMQVVFVGDVDRKTADDVRLVKATETAAEERFYRQGKLVGAVLIGETTSRMAIATEIRG